MTDKTEALRLAGLNECAALAWIEGSEPNLFRKETAALLRSQHARIERMEKALRYYRDECSGSEPSLSVFHKMLDEALEQL